MAEQNHEPLATPQPLIANVNEAASQRTDRVESAYAWARRNRIASVPIITYLLFASLLGTAKLCIEVWEKAGPTVRSWISKPPSAPEVLKADPADLCRKMANLTDEEATRASLAIFGVKEYSAKGTLERTSIDTAGNSCAYINVDGKTILDTNHIAIKAYLANKDISTYSGLEGKSVIVSGTLVQVTKNKLLLLKSTLEVVKAGRAD